jgi:hypothetical protein
MEAFMLLGYKGNVEACKEIVTTVRYNKVCEIVDNCIVTHEENQTIDYKFDLQRFKKFLEKNPFKSEAICKFKKKFGIKQTWNSRSNLNNSELHEILECFLFISENVRKFNDLIIPSKVYQFFIRSISDEDFNSSFDNKDSQIQLYNQFQFFIKSISRNFSLDFSKNLKVYCYDGKFFNEKGEALNLGKLTNLYLISNIKEVSEDEVRELDFINKKEKNLDEDKENIVMHFIDKNGDNLCTKYRGFDFPNSSSNNHLTILIEKCTCKFCKAYYLMEQFFQNKEIKEFEDNFKNAITNQIRFNLQNLPQLMSYFSLIFEGKVIKSVEPSNLKIILKTDNVIIDQSIIFDFYSLFDEFLVSLQFKGTRQDYYFHLLDKSKVITFKELEKEESFITIKEKFIIFVKEKIAVTLIGK